MLHGYAQNGNLFSKRLGAIRKAAGKSCEFVFLDGPHILKPADLPLDFGSLERPAVEVEKEPDPELIPRAWWRANEDRTIYWGIDESLIYVRDFLRTQVVERGPFDIVFGFSQGAAMAALLTILLERPTSYTPVPFVDSETQRPIHPPFQRAIFGSGFRPADQTITRLFGEDGQKLLGSQTRTLHLNGRYDPVVSMQRMRTLVDCCHPKNMRVEEHDGGHFIPSQSNWRQFISNYLNSDDIDLVPSPTASTVATPEKEIGNRL